MELVAFVTFTYTYIHSPLSPKAFGTSPPLTPTHPPTFLAALFLTHYLNRALISPLRTPSRSNSHLIVVLSAVVFNILNGSLLGAYLSSPAASVYLAGAFQVGYLGGLYMDYDKISRNRNTYIVCGFIES